MGKGTIQGGGPAGYYSVEINSDLEAISERKVSLQGRLIETQRAWVEASNDLENKEDALDALKSEQNALIDTYNADPTPENFAAINAKGQEVAAAAAEVGKQRPKPAALRLEILSIEAEIAKLANAENSQEIVWAWCADYSEGLTGEVGLVEIPGGDGGQHLQLRPGYGGAASYSGSRDGIMRQPFADSPAGTFWNWAMLPGWQRWLPRYRVGEITALDAEADTCSLTLEAETSSEQALAVDYGYAYTDVSISYMDCDAEIFEVGDRVLVEFSNQDATDPTGNWDSANLTVIGFVEEPRPCGYVGSFVFVPISDTAEYGWGDPYENPPGTPVNPPLGTVLADHDCQGVPTWPRLDGSKHPHRLFETGGTPELTHGTSARAGFRWWKYENYVISWYAPLDIENIGNETLTNSRIKNIYRNGAVLAYGPVVTTNYNAIIDAAALKKIGNDVYLYVVDGSSDDEILLYRAIVNPAGTNQTLTWSSVDLLPLIEDELATPYYSARVVYADFNASCTELVISQYGHRLVIDISTWNDASIVNNEWFHDSVITDSGSGADNLEWYSGEITVPVVSGYAAGSDVRQDVEIKVEMSARQWGGGSPEETAYQSDQYLAKVYFSDSLVKTATLYHRHVNTVDGYTDGNFRQEINFFTMMPKLQDPKIGVFFFQTSQIRDGTIYYNTDDESSMDALAYRKSTNEVYKGAARQAVNEESLRHWDTTENGFDLDWETAFFANNAQLRDAYFYPQYSTANRNERWIYPGGYPYTSGVSIVSALKMIGSEVLGASISPQEGADLSSIGLKMVDDVREDPSVALQPWKNVAFAVHPDGAAVFSARILTGYTETDHSTEWWNVYVRAADLLDESSAVGNNQRLFYDACDLSVSGYVPDQRHIGVYAYSTDNPFA